jgi:DNA-binding response OmpR family regulator
MRAPTVLVVDDDAETRETLAVQLTGYGLSVMQASTGHAALEVVRAMDIAAVILDVVLPDGCGYEVCHELRAPTSRPRIPVIMITALTGVLDEVRGVLAGADAYLVKPVASRDLIRRLQEII